MAFRFFSHFGSTRKRRKLKPSRIRTSNEQLEARLLLAADYFQNVQNPYDVNNDGYVTPLDVSIVVGEINAASARDQQSSARAMAAGGEGEPGSGNTNVDMFFDVNGDGFVSPVDVANLVETLNAEGEPGDVVTFRLETTDLNGNVITTIDNGQEFILRVLTSDTQAQEPVNQDGNPAGFGVFAAYLDVEYDADKAAVVGSIERTGGYVNAPSGDTSTDGLIDEVGGFSGSTTPVGQGEFELFKVRMRAEGLGTINFTSNPADVLPAHAINVYGRTDVIPNGDVLFGNTSLQVTGDQTAEQDLVAFAKALADAGVELWTSEIDARGNAAEQLDLFEEGQHFLPIREMRQSTNAGLQPSTLATDNNRTVFNQWVFPNTGETNGEVLTLQQVAQRAGVTIPTGIDPTIVPIDDVTVLQGSPLHIPLDGYDPNGDPLTYTISIDNTSLLQSTVLENNRSMRITTTAGGEATGDIVLELFEGRAPRATSRFVTLAGDDFFDGIIFHRVINNFMIQGGDPTGTGTGGSTLGDFDDQFHVDLQHNRPGVLSMAKSDDDTNDSQFFITEVPTRHLDSNHTVFGQVVEGDRVRETISNQPTGARDKPTADVVMTNVETFTDTENGVVMLRALAASGSTTVTVTATDSAGNSTTEQFNVNLAADTSNSPPFLDDIANPSIDQGTPFEFDVDASDVEGDAVQFDVEVVNPPSAGFSASVDDNGLVSFQTPAGFAGTFDLNVSVRAAGTSTTAPTDSQRVTVTINNGNAPAAPTSVDLLSASDSGLQNNDNVTRESDLQFEVAGVTSGATVRLFAGNTEIGQGLASGSTVTITTSNAGALADGQFLVTATQTIGGLESARSAGINLQLDRTAPVAISNTAPTTATVGDAYSFDAAHAEEATPGFRYSLGTAPTGASIDATTGVVSWTPTDSQQGTNRLQIITTDRAGNTFDNDIDVNVVGTEEARVRLLVTDTSGNPIGGIARGGDFQLRVLIQDQRDNGAGLQSASVDIAFDSARATVDGAIQVSDDFGNKTGTAGSGTITDVGGTANNALGDSEVLLATIPMNATSSGKLDFTVSIAAGDLVFQGGTNVDVADVDLANTSVIVLDVATALTANDDTFTVTEDTTDNELDVLTNDVLAANSQIVNVTATGTPDEQGAVSISSDRRAIVYTPRADFASTETFTYTIEDSQGATSTATVTVTVEDVNDPPTASDRNFPADFGANEQDQVVLFIEDSNQAFTLRPLSGGETAPDSGELVSVTAVDTSGTTSQVTLVESPLGLINDVVSYRPGPNVFRESLTYTITDVPLTSGDAPRGLTDTATLEIRLAQRNDAPVAVSDAFDLQPGQPLTISSDELLDNDTAGPLEDDVQDIEITGVTQGSKGTVVLNSNGSITYTPNSGATGTDTFTYTITDDGIDETIQSNGTFVPTDRPLEATGTVTINLNVGNAAPTAFDDQFSVVASGNAVTLDVLENDRDDGNSLTLTEVTASNGGQVSIVNNRVSYTPASGFTGTEVLTYTVSDGELTDQGEARVQVSADGGNATNSRFAGSVYFDTDSDGQRDDNEQGIAGVTIVLEGTDASGNPVRVERVTDTNGLYAFDALAKGTYTVTQQQPAFLVDGQETADTGSTVVDDGSDGNGDGDAFQFTVGDTVVNSANNLFAERMLSPRFSMLDAVSSNRGQGFLTATTNGQSQFVRNPSGWDDFSSINVALSDDGQQVIVTAVDNNSNAVRATLSVSDKTRVRMYGRDGDTFLIRIAVAAAALDFQPDTA